MKCISAMTYVCSLLEGAISEMGNTYVWTNNMPMAEVKFRLSELDEDDYYTCARDCNYRMCTVQSVRIEPDKKIKSRNNIIMTMVDEHGRKLTVMPDRLTAYGMQAILNSLPQYRSVYVDAHEYMVEQLRAALTKCGGEYDFFGDGLILKDDYCCGDGDYEDDYEYGKTYCIVKIRLVGNEIEVIHEDNYYKYHVEIDMFNCDEIYKMVRAIRVK